VLARRDSITMNKQIDQKTIMMEMMMTISKLMTNNMMTTMTRMQMMTSSLMGRKTPSFMKDTE
jgi:hypothetical protein